jgi:penicillin-binding protein 2
VNVPGGTARLAKVEGINVSGKTGTAENPHGEDHAWFVCFAPSEKPTIAMCVMIENIGFGGTHSAPVARQILEAYFYPERGAKILDSLENLKKGIITQPQSAGAILPLPNKNNDRIARKPNKLPVAAILPRR